jgi:hypothetical protein
MLSALGRAAWHIKTPGRGERELPALHSEQPDALHPLHLPYI